MIAVVPARGGSKGVQRKNLRIVDGKPLILHTLFCALAAPGVSRVIVSTDDNEIASVAAAIPGVEVPFIRPRALASDTASSVDVYLHAAEVLNVGEIVALLPTVPLRSPNDVASCIALFQAEAAHVVLSVVEAKPASWQQLLMDDKSLRPVPGLSHDIKNRQEHACAVMPNGAVYVLNTRALAETRTYFGERTFGFLMPTDRSIDIDSEADIKIAEALLMYARLKT